MTGRDDRHDRARGASRSLSLQHGLSIRFGALPPGFLIRHLQRHENVLIRLNEERHVGKRVAGRDRFDKGFFSIAGGIGRKRKRFVYGKLEKSVIELFPDFFVDALWVTLGWREQIDHQNVDAIANVMNSVFNEIAKGYLTRFVAGRDDFKRCHDIAKHMANNDLVRFGCVSFHLKSGLRRRIQKCDASAGMVASGPAFKRQSIGIESAGKLFDEGKQVGG